jgi:tRNA threonylcarbamoyladenosine biosynthesis protein TsaB
MVRVLTLDASMAVCSAGLVEDGVVLGWGRVEGDLAALPSLVGRLLVEHGRAMGLVAVIVGPGSFTGLRASVALAHGVGLAAGVPVVGVTVGSALVAEAGLPVWAAVDSKRGRVFLERDGLVESFGLYGLPVPEGPIGLGGDAALIVAEILAGRGADVRLMAAATPEPAGIARAALAGRTLVAQPIYVDPPAARPGPAARPPPA